MASIRSRIKLLSALRTTPHRYSLIRAVSQSVSIAILLLVPLLGLARVDAWGGHHWLLGRPAALKPALAGVIVGVAALYVVTFLSNVVAGRLFCGWGCPVGQVSRFGEGVDLPGLKPRQRMMARIKGALFSAVFVVSVMAWWVDLRVLVSGDAATMALAWGLLAIGAAGAYAHGRWWRWEFCKRVCPIGVYYSFVAPARYYGVHYRNERETCLDCDACDNVCPVNLEPRDLMKPATDRGGISLTDAPGHNHCLECGDCIRACEWMIEKRGSTPVPLRLGWFQGQQRVEPREASGGESPVDPGAHGQAAQSLRLPMAPGGAHGQAAQSLRLPMAPGGSHGQAAQSLRLPMAPGLRLPMAPGLRLPMAPALPCTTALPSTLASTTRA